MMIRLLKRIVSSKRVLYDGSSYREAAESNKIELPKVGVLTLPISISENNIERFLQNLRSHDQQRLINDEKLSNKPPNYLREHLGDRFETLKYDYHYLGDTLPVGFVLKDGFVVLYCFGETQPSRWILAITSMWEITNTPV